MKGPRPGTHAETSVASAKSNIRYAGYVDGETEGYGMHHHYDSCGTLSVSLFSSMSDSNYAKKMLAMLQ